MPNSLVADLPMAHRRRGYASNKPPSLPLALTELSRAGFEVASLAPALRRLIKRAPAGDGHPVLALPGYGGGDGSMAAMRYFLGRIGYDAYALEMGRNHEGRQQPIRRIEEAVAFREKNAAQVAQRVKAIYRATGRPVSLVGWSMGGLYAFDVSQSHPEEVRQVITLGSPFGSPQGTSAFNLLRKLNRSNVPVHEQDFGLWTRKRDLRGDSVPVSVLYSHQDGIVGRETARLSNHPSVQHYLVPSSHVGFAMNPAVLARVSSLLPEAAE